MHKRYKRIGTERERVGERERARDSRETDINTTIPDIQKLVVNYPQ